jgi:predicted RNase H-like nuclease
MNLGDMHLMKEKQHKIKMFFVGIDLAWSTRNGSGIVILKGDKSKVNFVCGDVLHSDKEIINYIEKNVKDENAFISIDTPLIVPNLEGRRIAEVKVGELFRKYNAGAHPSNRRRLSQWTGTIRGEEISKKLIKKGFKHHPYIKKHERTRKFFEVYPHPSMVVLFNLDVILKYKLKPKRDYEFRWKEFKKYQNHLKKINSLNLPNEIINKNVRKLRGNALKSYEDLLDGVFCAYLSYYHWTNPDKCKVLGNMKGGYKTTPIFDFMKK